MHKVLKLPTLEAFEKSMDEAQEWAASVGYREEDIEEIIQSVRAEKSKCESESNKPAEA